MIKFIKSLFNKTPEKKEKIRLKVRNGKLVSVFYPASITKDPMRMAILRQQVACYEIELNGNPLLRGLGRG